MRFFLCLVAVAAVLAFAGPAHAGRYAAIVVDADSGRTLHRDRADVKRYPASLTKMMTLYLVFERLERGALKLSHKFKVPREATRQPPSKIGVRLGERISVDTAIRALVVKSANDVATAVAHNIGGSERKFARMMTARARKLGLNRTVFRNASGLWHSGQHTTARDMARLARALVRDFPQYYKYFSLRKFKYKGRTYRSHNRLVGSYRGADGLKTGFISKSGFNLAFSARRNGRRLITVVMGGASSKARNKRVALLTDRAFAKLNRGGVPRKGSKPLLVSGRPGGWAVQVAAVPDRKSARSLARKAARRVALPEGGSWGAWPKRMRNGGTLHQARLIGFDRSSARRACRALRKAGGDCFVVQHGASAASVRVASARNGRTAHPPVPSIRGGRAVPPERAPRRVAGSKGNYAVQVGAYRSQKVARAEARKAAKLVRLPSWVDVGAWRQRGASNGRTLYLARFVGLKKAAAKQTCRSLKRLKRACFVTVHRSGNRVAALFPGR